MVEQLRHSRRLLSGHGTELLQRHWLRGSSMVYLLAKPTLGCCDVLRASA
ncbi:MAG: hypothetical protein RMI91_14090 [Gemmatales bacterium]|nr:hypothetical protein [Gemmatales bacterium]MDW7995776.1 hypothetical protein [Gemmatales bacterium]